MSKTLVLFDIDGTIADDSHRIHFALNKEWVQYFDPTLVALDSVIAEGHAYVELALQNGLDVGYLTGRRDTLYDTTAQWLARNGFPAGVLLGMRRMEQKKRLAEFKLDAIGYLLADFSNDYDSVILYEDDPEVVRVINEVFPNTARLVPWANKPEALIKKTETFEVSI